MLFHTSVVGLLLFVTSVIKCVKDVNIFIQPPRSELAVGSSVTLTCNIEVESNVLEDGNVSWQHPPNLVDASNFEISGEYFTITSVSENNIGVYVCSFIVFSDGVLYKGEASSEIRIKPERPGQPQKLHVSSFFEDTATLQWEPGFWGYADTLYYRLEIMKEDSSWIPWREDISADVATYIATRLSLEMSYRFRISQVSKGGESYPSDPTSPIYLAKTGAVTVFPTLERVEQYNSTAIRVIWRMSEFGDIITEWYVEYRLSNAADGNRYKAVLVTRDDVSAPTIISIVSGLEEASPYQIRMYCRNDNGRGPPSPAKEITTNEAPPSAPPSSVRADLTIENDRKELEVRWSPPPPKDTNGQLTGYQLNVYYSDPNNNGEKDDIMEVDVGLGTVISVSPKSLPCWVAVAARTSEGMGPFSNFKKVIVPVGEPGGETALDEVMALFKQPWIIALIGAFLLILIVMISIIVCRQQKIKRRKLVQQQHQPFFNSYQNSVNGQCRMSRDDGPQYEKIPDSGTTTPHEGSLVGRDSPASRQSTDMTSSKGTCSPRTNRQSTVITNNRDPCSDYTDMGGDQSNTASPREGSSRSYDGRLFDSRGTPNSFIDNRIPPPTYCPSNLSMDSQRYSMSQNSSIDDLASTVPSVTYSIPHNREGYKVVNPTANDRNQQDIPVAKVPPKAKEQDPNAIKPKVYGNITVKEWRERQLRKKPRGDGNSDTSLLSSFGKDSGRGSTDNVSVSASESEGSDIEKYLEEDFSPRNSGYIEDDLIDVARMGMTSSPPESSAFLNRGKHHHPPVTLENNNYNGEDDTTSIESDQYMRCEIAPQASLPVDIYNLNGGVSEVED